MEKYNYETDGPVVTVTGLKAYNDRLSEKLSELTGLYESLSAELKALKQQVNSSQPE